MVNGCGDLNYNDRLSLLEEQMVRGDLIETFKLLKGIDMIDFRKSFKLFVDFKVIGHTCKIVKNCFFLMLGKISLVTEL